VGLFEAILLAALSAAALLFLLRLATKRAGPRLALALSACFLLGGVAVMFGAGARPGPLGFLFPYRHLGTFVSTDLDRRECTVDVYAKALSSVTPPGALPRMKLVARTPSGTAETTYDTGWRFWVGNVRPVDGGIEIYHAHPHGGGVRFHLKDDRWTLAEEGVLGVDSRDLVDPELAAVPEDLRALIKLIHNSPGPEAGWFNPAALVRATNGLRAAGKEGAIRALRAYCDLVRPYESNGGDRRADRVLPILRLLFTPGAGAPERSRLRESVLRDVEVDPSAWPLFPLVIQDDIPFLPAPHDRRYAHEVPGDALAAVNDAAEFGLLRDEPLSPRTSPCQAALHLMASPAWKHFARQVDPGAGPEGDLLIQALVATHSICPVTANQYTSLQREAVGTNDPEWRSLSEAVRALAPKWDAGRQEFIAGKPSR
jgi:hypothetical protein